MRRGLQAVLAGLVAAGLAGCASPAACTWETDALRFPGLHDALYASGAVAYAGCPPSGLCWISWVDPADPRFAIDLRLQAGQGQIMRFGPTEDQETTIRLTAHAPEAIDRAAMVSYLGEFLAHGDAHEDNLRNLTFVAPPGGPSHWEAELLADLKSFRAATLDGETPAIQQDAAGALQEQFGPWQFMYQFPSVSQERAHDLGSVQMRVDSRDVALIMVTSQPQGIRLEQAQGMVEEELSGLDVDAGPLAAADWRDTACGSSD